MRLKSARHQSLVCYAITLRVDSRHEPLLEPTVGKGWRIVDARPRHHLLAQPLGHGQVLAYRLRDASSPHKYPFRWCLRMNPSTRSNGAPGSSSTTARCDPRCGSTPMMNISSCLSLSS